MVKVLCDPLTSVPAYGSAVPAGTGTEWVPDPPVTLRLCEFMGRRQKFCITSA